MKGFDYDRLRDYVLPGRDPKEDYQGAVVCGIIWAVLTDILFFLVKYVKAWKAVTYFRTGVGDTWNFLDEGIVHILQFNGNQTYMPTFAALLAGSFSGVVIYSLYRAAHALSDKNYFTNGSKSIYLMNRLDEKHPIAKRCWGRALAGIASVVLCTMVLVIIDYLIYRFITPNDYLLMGVME